MHFVNQTLVCCVIALLFGCAASKSPQKNYGSVGQGQHCHGPQGCHRHFFDEPARINRFKASSHYKEPAGQLTPEQELELLAKQAHETFEHNSGGLRRPVSRLRDCSEVLPAFGPAPNCLP